MLIMYFFFFFLTKFKLLLKQAGVLTNPLDVAKTRLQTQMIVEEGENVSVTLLCIFFVLFLFFSLMPLPVVCYTF
jgi:hypothetical protein